MSSQALEHSTGSPPGPSPGAPSQVAGKDAVVDGQYSRIAAWSVALELATQTSIEQNPEILELAEALNTHFGWEPFHDTTDSPDVLAGIALDSLRIATGQDLDRAIEKLPVFPAAAQRALVVVLRDDWHAGELESIAGSDQALAAHLLKAANSWAHSPLREIVSLQHAITYIGAERTSRILYAAAVKPLFSGPALRDIWLHSLESAQVAQALAEVSGSIDPKEAFLAGLVHDMGRLAMAGLSGDFSAAYAKLIELGCESLLVERALSGFSHAQAGARALKFWKFPNSFVEAVEHHHQPERSAGKLASLLYLTEQWTDSCEDAPSAVRFRDALLRLGLRADAFAQLEVKSDRSLLSLQ